MRVCVFVGGGSNGELRPDNTLPGAEALCMGSGEPRPPRGHHAAGIHTHTRIPVLHPPHTHIHPPLTSTPAGHMRAASTRMGIQEIWPSTCVPRSVSDTTNPGNESRGVCMCAYVSMRVLKGMQVCVWASSAGRRVRRDVSSSGVRRRVYFLSLPRPRADLESPPCPSFPLPLSFSLPLPLELDDLPPPPRLMSSATIAVPQGCLPLPGHHFPNLS